MVCSETNQQDSRSQARTETPGVLSGKHKKSILRAQGSRSCTEYKPTKPEGPTWTNIMV